MCLVEHLFEQCCEMIVFDQCPRDPDAFVETNEVWAGVDMRLEPGRLHGGPQESAGRPLAVGSGDVEHGRQVIFRIAEPFEESDDAFQPEYIIAWGQAVQSIELSLDRRAFGDGMVGHELVTRPSCPG